MKTELVVANYNENLDWLNQLPGLDVAVYNKAEDRKKTVTVNRENGGKLDTIYLPNIGREPHSFLTHIVHNYAVLADITIFLQGDPIDHCADVIEKIRDIADGKLPLESNLLGIAEGAVNVPGYLPLADVGAWEDSKGASCFQNWEKNENKEPLPIEETWGFLFPDSPCPEWFHFHAGGQFAISKVRIQSRPQEFYENALEVASLEDWKTPHAFERLWARIFA